MKKTPEIDIVEDTQLAFQKPEDDSWGTMDEQNIIDTKKTLEQMQKKLQEIREH